MNVICCREDLTYDGSQLRSHWIYDRFGVQGDALVYFTGPAAVSGEALVDLVDRRQQETIRAALMLHFLVEHFDQDLHRAVLRQHLLCALVGEVVAELTGRLITRKGDDLFIDQRKLSVSIATVSPVSSLVHLGVNVDPTGAPIAAVGLGELKIDALQVGGLVAQRYADEVRQVAVACSKVRWVP
ncbi:MAG: DUF366 family protein [Armatimonadota bacterium]